jgi:hypothetical protein
MTETATMLRKARDESPMLRASVALLLNLVHDRGGRLLVDAAARQDLAAAGIPSADQRRVLDALHDSAAADVEFDASTGLPLVRLRDQRQPRPSLESSGHDTPAARPPKRDRAGGFAPPATVPGLESFGQALSRSRRRRVLTMDELSMKSQLSKSYISLLESGRAKPPSDDACDRLEDALDLPRGTLGRHARVLSTPPDVLALIDPDRLQQFLIGSRQ